VPLLAAWGLRYADIFCLNIPAPRHNISDRFRNGTSAASAKRHWPPSSLFPPVGLGARWSHGARRVSTLHGANPRERRWRLFRSSGYGCPTIPAA
jgi:hypothetical protein